MVSKEEYTRQYAKEITEIIEATTADPEDTDARFTIAEALAYSLDQAKSKTGKDQSVKDTDLYKLAEVMKHAGSQEECAMALKRAFPRRWSTILEKYNFNWKISCTPIIAGKKLRKAPLDQFEEKVEDLEKIVKDLEGEVGELKQEVRKYEE
jgi:hypothetical protein